MSESLVGCRIAGDSLLYAELQAARAELRAERRRSSSLESELSQLRARTVALEQEAVRVASASEGALRALLISGGWHLPAEKAPTEASGITQVPVPAAALPSGSSTVVPESSATLDAESETAVAEPAAQGDVERADCAAGRGEDTDAVPAVAAGSPALEPGDAPARAAPLGAVSPCLSLLPALVGRAAPSPILLVCDDDDSSGEAYNGACTGREHQPAERLESADGWLHHPTAGNEAETQFAETLEDAEEMPASVLDTGGGGTPASSIGSSGETTQGLSPPPQFLHETTPAPPPQAHMPFQCLQAAPGSVSQGMPLPTLLIVSGQPHLLHAQPPPPNPPQLHSAAAAPPQLHSAAAAPPQLQWPPPTLPPRSPGVACDDEGRAVIPPPQGAGRAMISDPDAAEVCRQSPRASAARAVRTSTPGAQHTSGGPLRASHPNLLARRPSLQVRKHSLQERKQSLQERKHKRSPASPRSINGLAAFGDCVLPKRDIAGGSGREPAHDTGGGSGREGLGPVRRRKQTPLRLSQVPRRGVRFFCGPPAAPNIPQHNAECTAEPAEVLFSGVPATAGEAEQGELFFPEAAAACNRPCVPAPSLAEASLLSSAQSQSLPLPSVHPCPTRTRCTSPQRFEARHSAPPSQSPLYQPSPQSEPPPPQEPPPVMMRLPVPPATLGLPRPQGETPTPVGAKRPHVPVYHQVIRNQAERARMPAQFCPECAAFFDAAGYGGPEHEKTRRSLHGYCSRHRSHRQRPDTPEGYWSFSSM